MYSTERRFGGRRTKVAGMLAAASAAGLSLGAGCPDDEDLALQAFRDTAAAGLRSGLTAISAGLIDGFFDAFEVDGAAGSDDNSNTNENLNDNA